MMYRPNGEPSLLWRRVAPAALGILILTGCSDSSEPTTMVNHDPASATDKPARNRLFSISYDFSDGRMVRQTEINDNSLDSDGSVTHAWCELNDLIEITDNNYGTTEELSPEHPAYVDSRLDPEDFDIKK